MTPELLGHSPSSDNAIIIRMRVLALLCVGALLNAPARSMVSTGSSRAIGLGIDLGTSGARLSAAVAEPHAPHDPRELHAQSIKWAAAGDAASPEAWLDAVSSLLDGVPEELCADVTGVCASGTSGSVLAISAVDGAVTRAPRMYNWAAPKQSTAAAMVARAAPAGHTARAPTSTLCKVLGWVLGDEEGGDAVPLESSTERVVHQADYVAMALAGSATPVGSDWHNALKLGYDVRAKEWPAWMMEAEGGTESASLAAHVAPLLEALGPVRAPGAVAAPRLGPRWGDRFPRARVVSGTTDSNAAFIASGAAAEGDAVTSLGSTLALKLLTSMPVEDSGRGVYSHAFFDGLYLAGGASNVGGACIRGEGFDDAELGALESNTIALEEARLAAGDVSSPCDYYPLPRGSVGERFPTADQDKRPRLGDDDAPDRGAHLHRILCGIARVEAAGYAALADLGAGAVRRVFSAGGGARSPAYTAVRQNHLGAAVRVESLEGPAADAAFGAARLALRAPEDQC